ncbi:MAG: AsnC family transcriptional regulator [Isosphaeraceae bacterium]|nr:AsnC family transcriptional regulator [Isosphaeraceae bacterium]
MSDSSDRPLLDIIRRDGPLSVADMASRLGVTPTAVRNRLTRLLGSGLIERRTESVGRGRPKHTYRASVEAHKQLGQNYTDLALVLWDELMHAVEDRKLRRLIFGRITEKLAELYRSQLKTDGREGKMLQLGSILHDRGIEVEVVTGDRDSLPILKQHSCPYFALAEVDRAVCAMERKMFEKVLGQSLRLSQCRLDGHKSCDFEAKPDGRVASTTASF